MEIKVFESKGVSIAEIVSEKIVINETQDAVDLMGNCTYNGSYHIIVHQKNLCPDFFDLKTRLAGDILQKFSNYNVKLAIIGSFDNVESKSLKDFIFESNKHGQINFVGSKVDAIDKLTK